MRSQAVKTVPANQDAPSTNIPMAMNNELNQLGISGASAIHANLSAAQLVEQALRRNEIKLSADGAVVAITTPHTGRTPDAKYLVRDDANKDQIDWGKVNQPYESDKFAALKQRITEWLKGRELFVQDLYVGADEPTRLKIRVINTNAWHNMFARNMFIRPTAAQLAKGHTPEFTVIHVPEFQADPAIDGTNSGTFVMIDFARKLVMIGGTSYAGEIKKSIFTVMNYILPTKGIMPMHASANQGDKGDVAIFFGLSGTGKTTLSADSSRTLIGDDEHGWSDNAVFNFEGGCYAKAIRLSPKQEPEIYAAARRFGTVLENVVMNPETRMVDFDDATLAENSRACYPIEFIPNASATGAGGLPQNVFMLTCDAYGVLPPIAKLTPEQAMYHFLSGYTARVAGTEKGVTEPQATFSACFGAPFMPRSPEVYAHMLGEKLNKHNVHCWLINTGWSGGAYGTGQRMPINVTRTLLRAALNGELAKVEFKADGAFGLMVPKAVAGIDNMNILHPREMWADKAAYDAQAKKLIDLFANNFKKFESKVTPQIMKAAMGV